MRLPQKTEDALACCLDAVADPLNWGAALQSLGESLGAQSCTLGSGELQKLSSLVMPVSTGHEAFRDLWLRNERHAPDPHFEQARWRKHRGAAVVSEHQLCSDDERRTLPYFRETAEPAKREWLANSMFTAGNSRWWMAVYRSAERGPFAPGELQCLALVGPRLAPIVSMAEKFSAFQIASGLLGLDHARCAAFVADVRGRVVNMNRRAEEMLGSDFHLVGGRLVAGDASSSLSLQHLVTRSIAARKGETLVPGPVAIRRGGNLRYLVEAVPVSSLTSACFSAAKVLLLVTDLKAKAAPPLSLLRQNLGLTTAEARLAQLFASGHDLQEAIALLEIKMPTARSQLRAIFQKTGTCRQAELACLLTRLTERCHSQTE